MKSVVMQPVSSSDSTTAPLYFPSQFPIWEFILTLLSTFQLRITIIYMYMLVAVVYYANQHFTSKVIMRDGRLWFYYEFHLWKLFLYSLQMWGPVPVTNPKLCIWGLSASKLSVLHDHQSLSSPPTTPSRCHEVTTANGSNGRHSAMGMVSRTREWRWGQGMSWAMEPIPQTCMFFLFKNSILLLTMRRP